MDQLILAMEDRKEKITEKLSTVYSLNRISIEEYERLIKYSQDIETEKELQILENLIKGYNTDQSVPEEKKNESIFGYDDEISTRSTFIDNQGRDQFSILSSRKTTGILKSGNYINVLSSHKIVVSDKDLVNNDTVLNFTVILGDVTILVSENINVINKAFPILGDVSIANNVRERGGNKNLVITGRVVLGNINVKVKKRW